MLQIPLFDDLPWKRIMLEGPLMLKFSIFLFFQTMNYNILRNQCNCLHYFSVAFNSGWHGYFNLFIFWSKNKMTVSIFQYSMLFHTILMMNTTQMSFKGPLTGGTIRMGFEKCRLSM
ncbi:Hypothetical_protein [Hexamita inflata]|uniref:Hypothetical_protein n=1 Tax=Hexamita inflata TaxID=28002 RepID=A0AA86VU03_9EUKA|nr:Hypothetical protein HINF_LOCUS65868 [Hexamita inflata]